MSLEILEDDQLHRTDWIHLPTSSLPLWYLQAVRAGYHTPVMTSDLRHISWTIATVAESKEQL